jgi:hypothetical protein
MKNVKTEIQKMNLAELNDLSDFISQMKVIVGKATLSVGQKVFVVQKTKCLVDMSGRSYRVPMSMLEAA